MSHTTPAARAVVIAFALILGAAWLVPGPPVDENRERAEWPRPTRATVTDASFFRAVDDALVDRMPLKGAVVRTVSGAVVSAGLSPSTMVFRGDDGRPYYASDFTGPCWTLQSLPAYLDVIRGLRDRLAAAGTTFVYAITPDKSSIEPERVGPFAERLSTCSKPAQEFWHAASAEEPMIFTAWDELEAAADAGEQVHFFGDTHWTFHGAAIYSGLLLDHLVEMGAAPAGLDHAAEVTRIDEIEYSGDLFALMGSEHTEPVPVFSAVRPGVTTTMTESDGVQHWVSESTGAPLIGGRTLILRDSMWEFNDELLAPYFADITAIPSLDSELGATLAPGYDLVIVQQAQRIVPRYLEDISGASWLARG